MSNSFAERLKERSPVPSRNGKGRLSVLSSDGDGDLCRCVGLHGVPSRDDAEGQSPVEGILRGLRCPSWLGSSVAGPRRLEDSFEHFFTRLLEQNNKKSTNPQSCSLRAEDCVLARKAEAQRVMHRGRD